MEQIELSLAGYNQHQIGSVQGGRDNPDHLQLSYAKTKIDHFASIFQTYHIRFIFLSIS
jgi:hypothetical protein